MINVRRAEKSYFDKGLEAFVFGQEVLVEVYSFCVAAAESSINPLHAFTVGSWELEQNLTGMNTQNTVTAEKKKSYAWELTLFVGSIEYYNNIQSKERVSLH